jgi:hypothetical protein
LLKRKKAEFKLFFGGRRMKNARQKDKHEQM